MYKVDIAQIDKEWIKGRLQQCVCDSDGNVIAVCGENRALAIQIADALNASGAK